MEKLPGAKERVRKFEDKNCVRKEGCGKDCRARNLRKKGKTEKRRRAKKLRER
jgi:hypothetical protein